MKIEQEDTVYVNKKEEKGENPNSAVSVLGQVARPGNFDYVPEMTVARVISEAQGFTRFANSSQVKITRISSDGRKTTLQVNVSAIMDGRADDVKLEPGDIIFVPESNF